MKIPIKKMIQNPDEIFISDYKIQPDKDNIAIKDNICTKDFFATCGSLALKDYSPGYDATAVAKLREHNYYISGKTNMDEFAMGSTGLESAYGNVTNPLNSDYIAGGSSSGSAAAVSSGIVDIALGSDTGGSVRLPAAFCGIYGFKPTYGAVSRYGLISFASSFDVIGILSNNLKKLIKAFGIIAGKDNKDSTSINIDDETNFTNKKKIAALDIGNINVSNEIRNTYKDYLNNISKKYNLKIIKLNTIEYWLSTYFILTSCEAVSNLSRYDNKLFGNKDFKIRNFQTDYKKFRTLYLGDEVKRRILTGNFALNSQNYNKYYHKAAQVRRKIKNEISAVFKEYDILLSPTSPSLPFKICDYNFANNYKLDIFTSGISLAGNPAISVPSKNKIGDFYPGIQISAGYGKDFQLLKFTEEAEYLF